MSEVGLFHDYAHVFISLIGAVLLMAIYYNIKTRFSQILEEDESHKRVDRGLLYLSLAMFTWVISGLWSIVHFQFSWPLGFTYQFGENLFSIINNMFLLLALYYFYYAPQFIYKNEKNVRIIIVLIAVVTFVTLGISYFFGNTVYQNVNLTTIPDLILSGFLSGLLMISLYKTFLHRGLKLVAMISVLVIVLIFCSQLSSSFLTLENDFVNNLLKIVAKTSLIALFLVLATSWVIQLANTPRINEIQIKFLDWSLIQLSIPSKNILGETIDFGSKTTQYKNLLKLAIRRKYVESGEQSMLVGNAGEIKNQTYLTRIIENINEILQLDESFKLDRKDLFTFLGEGRYRLRMLPEHIKIEEGLLKEFVRQEENKDYFNFIELNK